MPLTSPKSLFSSSRSSFSLIDPATDKFHRRLDRHGYLTSGLRRHVTISYVWSEWKNDRSDKLPDWTAVRERLLCVVGSGAPSLLKVETGNASTCWIDCKCIDQDADTDKAYWIPRMDEIYYEARCTILLLRNLDLTVLQEVARDMSCPFKGKLNSMDELLAPHNCQLSQNCTVLPDLDPDRELRCLDGLRALAGGVWRRRAWILQEILLSRNYLLSWGPAGWMSLADAGVIAAILSRRHPTDGLIADLATWCRRLWFLRENFGEAQTFELSDANVLQLSAGLEATVPADKFYALCGVLRLKNIQYNSAHSADAALQHVVSELVRKGRLSWLYAVRPPLQGSPDVVLTSSGLAPFLLTRLQVRLFANRHKMQMAAGSLAFQALEIGTVVSTQPLRQFLAQAVAHFRDSSSPEVPPEVAQAPGILRRLALDIVDPLTTVAISDTICEALGIAKEVGSRNVRLAIMVMALYALEADHARESGLTGDESTIHMVTGLSFSLQSRISSLMESFNVVTVSYSDVNDGGLGTGKKARQETLLGFPAAVVGSSVYSVAGDKSLLLSASPGGGAGDADAGGAGHSAFQGMLFQIGVSQVNGPPPSNLFDPSSWKSRGRGAKPGLLSFPFKVAGVPQELDR